jgi:hypothetical protein
LGRHYEFPQCGTIKGKLLLLLLLKSLPVVSNLGVFADFKENVSSWKCKSGVLYGKLEASHDTCSIAYGIRKSC